MTIRTYFVALTIFFIIDIIWLVFIARNLYQQQIGHLLMDKPNWVAAIIFYLIFIFGLVHFVIAPGIESNMLGQVILNGLLFGFITYGTYDLTNLATLENWPIKITIIDLIWGSVLGSSVSVMTYFVEMKVFR